MIKVGDKLQRFLNVWTVVKIGMFTATLEEHNGDRHDVNINELLEELNRRKSSLIQFRSDEVVTKTERAA